MIRMMVANVIKMRCIRSNGDTYFTWGGKLNIG